MRPEERLSCDSWARLEYPPFGLDLFFLGSQLSALEVYLSSPPPPPDSIPSRKCPVKLERELNRYFRGQPVHFSFPTVFLPPHTAFQRRVWTSLKAIPYGQTRTYGWVASRLGRPLGARAVGGALGRNPLPVILPCHRVIGATGDLVGFSSGLDVKRRLLELEGVSL